MAAVTRELMLKGDLAIPRLHGIGDLATAGARQRGWATIWRHPRCGSWWPGGISARLVRGEVATRRQLMHDSKGEGVLVGYGSGRATLYGGVRNVVRSVVAGAPGYRSYVD